MRFKAYISYLEEMDEVVVIEADDEDAAETELTNEFSANYRHDLQIDLEEIDG